MTAGIQLDLLKRFNPSDTRDASEDHMETTSEKDMEMEIQNRAPPAMQANCFALSWCNSYFCVRRGIVGSSD